MMEKSNTVTLTRPWALHWPEKWEGSKPAVKTKSDYHEHVPKHNKITLKYRVLLTNSAQGTKLDVTSKKH